MPHGNRTFLWLEPRASATVLKQVSAPETATTRFRFGGQSIFVGDLVQNEFVLSRNPGSTAPRGFSCMDAERERFALSPQLFKAIETQYTAHLRKALQELLRLPSVRHNPGPFLIEGQYYTDTFYEIARALEDPAHTRMCADWFLRQLTNSSDSEPPDVLIATTVTVIPVLRDLADLVRQFFVKLPDILEPTDTTSPAWAIRQLLPSSVSEPLFLLM